MQPQPQPNLPPASANPVESGALWPASPAGATSPPETGGAPAPALFPLMTGRGRPAAPPPAAPAVPKRHHQGFTLLEVLLAVGIFAIVLFAMNTVFFSALRLERATNRAVDERLPLNQALAMVRQDLQGAVPPLTNSTLLPRHFVATASGGGFGAAQSGSLEFYTTTGTLSDSEPWGEVQRVRLELVAPLEPTANPNSRELVRRVRRNVLATATEEEDEQLLASDIESLEFQCYTGSDWRSTWNTESGDVGLPLAVRVRLHLAANDYGAGRLTQEPLELLVPLTTQTLTNSGAGGGL